MKAIQKIVGQLIGMSGAFLNVVGLYRLFVHRAPNPDVGFVVFMLLLGGLFLLSGALLLRPTMTQSLPRFRLPAIAGIAGGFFVLAFIGCLIVSASSEVAAHSDLMHYSVVFSSLGALLAAIVCILTGISAFIEKEPKPEAEVR